MDRHTTTTGHEANTFLAGIDSFTEGLPAEFRDRVRANHAADIAANLPEGILPGYIMRNIISHPHEDAFSGSHLDFTYDADLWTPEGAAAAAYGVIEGNTVSIDDAYSRAVVTYNATAEDRGLEPIVDR